MMAAGAGPVPRRGGPEIHRGLRAVAPEPMCVGARTLDFTRTHVMGILNVTPDSFFDGGIHTDVGDAVAHAEEMVAQGADIIDVGGESTRPGSRSVNVSEEKERILPVIRTIRSRTDVPISVDTTKSEVARAALDEGANLINDISGLRFDPRLADLAAERGVPIVLMHSRHVPETMQDDVHYGDMRAEILAELGRSVDLATSRGVPRTRIIVDPGIGFAKRLEDNLEILAHPGFLAPLGLPVLVGPSNKSFIGTLTDAPVDHRTGGTAAAVAAAVLGGAHLVRVHDVRTMTQVVRVAEAIRAAAEGGQ